MEYNKPTRKNATPAQSTSRRLGTLLAGVLCIIVAVIVLNVDIVQIISNYRCQIKNGSEIFELLQQETDGVHVSAYLFNVTNAEGFLRGGDHKLKLDEVGPFTYAEMRSNLDMEVDEEAGVLRYSPYTVPVFLPEESIADPKDVVLTMPNIAMLAMSSMISSQGYFARTGFSVLLHQLRSKALVNLTAQDFLWGYDEPLIKLGNTFLPGWISFDTLGIMDRLYDKTKEYRLEVATAVGEKFKIKTMNGLGGLKDWGYEDPTTRTRCNTFTDSYEGIAYPNHLSPDAPLRLFRNLLCRHLDFEYQGPITTQQGAEAYQYRVSKRAYDIDNDTECLCSRGTCISGISDLSPCYYKLPLALSNAHFLDGDPKLLERFEGLHPSEDKHGSEIIVERKIGMVLNTSFTVQVNIVVSNIDFNAEAGRFSDMVVPVLWFKLTQPGLTPYTRNSLWMMYTFGPKLILAIVAVLCLVGTILVVYSTHHSLPRLAYAKGKGIIFLSPHRERWPANTVPLLSIRYLYSHK